jgi:hypothetical protein
VALAKPVLRASDQQPLRLLFADDNVDHVSIVRMLAHKFGMLHQGVNRVPGSSTGRGAPYPLIAASMAFSSTLGSTGLVM